MRVDPFLREKRRDYGDFIWHVILINKPENKLKVQMDTRFDLMNDIKGNVMGQIYII